MKLERGDDEEDRAWSVGIEKRLTEYVKVVEGLERSLREEETRGTQKEEQSKWEIKKKFEAKADGKEGDTLR